MSENNFKKEDLAKKLSQKTGYSLLFSKVVINYLINLLKVLIQQNNLVLKNFGTFKIINKKERTGRNPKTNEPYIIKQRNSIQFIASKNLIKKINQK